MHYYIFSFLLALILCDAVGCTNRVTGQPDLQRCLGGKRWDDEYAASLERKYANLSLYIANNYDGQDLAARTTARDTIITDLMWLSDYYYNQDKSNLFNGDNSINFLGDFTTAALTSAATLAGGAQTKTALSAVATLVTGTEAEYSSDFLHKQTLTSIINEMDALRADAETTLVTGLAHSDDVYPLRKKALGDLNAYDQSGSLANAIVKLGEQSKQSAEQAQANLRSTQIKLQAVADHPSTQP